MPDNSLHGVLFWGFWWRLCYISTPNSLAQLLRVYAFLWFHKIPTFCQEFQSIKSLKRTWKNATFHRIPERKWLTMTNVGFCITIACWWGWPKPFIEVQYCQVHPHYMQSCIVMKKKQHSVLKLRGSPSIFWSLHFRAECSKTAIKQMSNGDTCCCNLFTVLPGDWERQWPKQWHGRSTSWWFAKSRWVQPPPAWP